MSYGYRVQSDLLRVVMMTVIVTGACAAGCNRQPAADPQPAATKASSADPLEITATPTLLARIRVGELSWTEIGGKLAIPARIEADETRVTRVGSPVMGRILDLAAREGQDVQKGQLLALVNSMGLSEAQLAFLKAVSQKQVAQRAVERAQVLLKADVIGSAELQRREAELAQASAELDVARDQLMLLGMAPEAITTLEKTHQIHSVSRLVASMAGTVLDRKVTLGQTVQPADTAFEIADLSHLWLVADVPERDAGNLTVGQEVEAEVAALPGRAIRGRLAFVSATVNADTRTVRVRMDLPNPDRKFKPAMLATMMLKEQPERKQVLPSAAVVRDGNAEYVFIQRAADTFVLRPVSLDGEFEERRVLLAGVSPGEKIVVDGAFHLNNERRRRAVRGSDDGGGA
jgi:cobalt-zinc-cadmium efflux system membrane fusion protein